MSAKAFLQQRSGLGLLFIWSAFFLAAGFGALVGIGSPFLRTGALLAPAATLALLLGLRWPEILFYGLIGVIFVLGAIESTVIPETFLYLGIGALLIVSLAFRWITRRERPIIHLDSAVWALLLGIWATISALSSPQFGLVRTYWLVIVLFLLVPTFIQTPQQLRRFAWVIILAAAVAGLIALVQQLAVLGRAGAFDIRTLYFGTNRETGLDAGGVSSTRLSKMLPFAFALLLFERARPLTRVTLVGAAGVVLLASILTFSNNGLVGIALTFLLLAQFLPKRRDKIVILSLLAAGFIAFDYFALGERLIEQIDIVLSGEDFLTWGSGRGATIYMAWRSIQLAPFLGHGPGQAGHVLPTFLPLEYVRGASSDFVVPHNMLLSVWVDIGLPGLLCFLGLYGSVVLRLWRVVRKIDSRVGLIYQMLGYAVLIALLVFFVQGMFISVHLEKLMWVLLGAGVAFSLLADKGAFSLPAEMAALQKERTS